MKIDPMEIVDFKAELERLHGCSFGWALSCCRRDATEAEDVAQNVFIQVYKSAHRYEVSAKFSTWLFTIARNLSLNEIRSLVTSLAFAADNVQQTSDRHWTWSARRSSL